MWLAHVKHIKTDNIFDIIRVANQRVTQKESPKRNKKDTDRPKKSKDMYCDACGTHGHGWWDCDFLAKLVKALDFLSKMDSTKKQTLLETYHKEQLCQRH